MNEIKRRAIQKTVQGLNENYQSHELLTLKQGMELPNRKAVINILRDLKAGHRPAVRVRQGGLPAAHRAPGR